MPGLSLYCAGVVDTVALTCSTGWQAVAAAPPFDPSQLDPGLIAASVGAGLFVGTTVYGAAFGARTLLNFIKR